MFVDLRARLLLLILAGASTACSAIDPHGEGEPSVASERPVVGGQIAKAHTDAVLIDGGAICSGSLIAPRVVLTAAHCILSSSFDVLAPYAAYQKAHASTAATYDGIEAQPPQHDVGLIFLDSDIGLEKYPSVASYALDAGTEVVTIGRKQDGQLSSTDLFASSAHAISYDSGWPTDYLMALDVIQPGDSGGPAKRPGDPLTIHGVNSRGGGGVPGSLLARVDLVSAWVQQQIAAHPGGSTECATCKPPTDALPSCGELSQAWSLATLCEVNGNNACGGSGQASWDCDTCCTPSCEQLASANGWNAGTCDNPGGDQEGWCDGSGTPTHDCGLCCPG